MEIDELKKKKWSLYDVFHKIMEEERMGTLFIKGHEIDMEVGFQEGKIISIKNPPIRKESIIGRLKKLDLIDDSKIKQLQKKAEKKGIPFSEAIIYDKELTNSMALKIIDLEIKEALLDLFLRTGINCKFQWERGKGERLCNPLSVVSLLREAKIRAKKWPELLKKIPHTDMVFEKLPLLPLKEKDEEKEKKGRKKEIIKDEVFWEDLPLDGYEKTIFFYINGERTVEEIKELSGIGEFETIRAMANLLKKGFIKEVDLQKAPKKKSAIIPSKFIIIFHRVIFNIILLIFAFALAYGITSFLNHIPSYYKLTQERILWEDESLEILRLEEIIQLYFTIKGEFPSSIDSLIEAGLVSSNDSIIEKLTFLRAGREFVIKRKENSVAGGEK